MTPIEKYVRFEHAGRTAYGIWEGDVVRQLKGDIFTDGAEAEGREFPAADDVPVEAASDHVFGVTIGNDLVDREWLLEDLQWFRAKGSDTFGPIGPAIVRDLDYNSLELETRVNGEVRQASNTSELVFAPDELLSYCSRYVTLLPGDVLFTGTPGRTQAVEKGDVIEVEIEGIGVLRNAVAR